MKRFSPTIYRKNIYEVNYQKLKDMGIKYLIFDLDNTIALLDENYDYSKVKELLVKLKKDFKIVIISNNNKKRVYESANLLDVDYIASAMKPLTKGLHKIKNKYNLDKSQMCMIGDQLLTDILSGNLFGISTILVDPLGKKDLKITGFNRLVEKLIFKLSRNLKRGKYYE